MKKKIIVASILLMFSLSGLENSKAEELAVINESWAYDSLNVDSRLSGNGIKIGIMDTGIKEHDEYTISGGVNCYRESDDIENENLTHNGCVSEEYNPFGKVGYKDKDGHGTFIAGITSSKRNDGTKLKGIAPNAHLYALKFWKDDGSTFNPESFIRAVDWAIKNNINVLNISTSFPEFYKEDENLRNLLIEKLNEANKKGIYIVVSAGNSDVLKDEDGNPIKDEDGNQIEIPETISWFPQGHPLTTVVSGVYKSYVDNEYHFIERYARGEEVDITAPGYNVYSTGLNNFLSLQQKYSKYYFNEGTSFAAPFVAGTVALAKEKFPTYSNDDIYALLMLNAQKVFSHNDAWDEKVGYGLVQANFNKTLIKTKPIKIHLNKETTGHEIPNSDAKSESIPAGTYDSSTMYKDENGTYWYQVPIENQRAKWISTGELLTDTVSNRTVLAEIYNSNRLFDKKEDYTTLFSPNSKFIQRFEIPLQVRGFDIRFKNNMPKQNFEISFYGYGRSLLKTVNITEEGFYPIDDLLHQQTLYIQIKNTGLMDGELTEFNVLGSSFMNPIKTSDLNMSITLNSDNRTFYNDINNPTHFTTINYAKGKTFTVTKGANWNDDYHHYSKMMVTNEELGIKDQWIDVDFKSGEMKRIYETDLTSTMYGQIVKDEGNYYAHYITDDSTSYPPSLYPNKKYTYEFDYPVSVNGYYFNYILNHLDNKLKITLTNTDGIDFPIEVDDTALFYRHVSLPNDYKNIKKFTIENIGTEEFKMYEFALVGKENENKTFPEIDIQHPVVLRWMGFKLYDYPNSPTYTTVSYLPDNKTVFSKKGYGLISSSDIFSWMQIEWNGELKWVNYKDVNMGNLYKNGLVDSVGGTVLPEKNSSWTYYIFNEYGIPATIYPEGFAEYEFNSPVSIKEMYFSSGDYIDNSDNKIVLELSDKDKNVIYTRNISRNDLYRRFVPFEKTYENIKFVKIKNSGKYNAKISKVNFK